jgi:hypothetical protein
MERGSRGLELPESLYTSVYIRDHEVPRIRYSINGHGLGSPADDTQQRMLRWYQMPRHSLILFRFDELYKDTYLLPDLSGRAVTDCVTWTAQHGRSQDYTLLRRREPVLSYSVPCTESE